jgi:hypothetical protein
VGSRAGLDYLEKIVDSPGNETPTPRSSSPQAVKLINFVGYCTVLSKANLHTVCSTH